MIGDAVVKMSNFIRLDCSVKKAKDNLYGKECRIQYEALPLKLTYVVHTNLLMVFS